MSTIGFELLNQIADRVRTLWSIIIAMQIRGLLHRCSHCALLLYVVLAVINKEIHGVEFQNFPVLQLAVYNLELDHM
jgi:hypothetical protein